jgi:hypothetical protein
MGCKVSVKVFGCSTDDYTNSVDFIEITLHSIVLKALAVLPGSAGLAIAVLPGRWRISAPGSSAHSTSQGMVPVKLWNVMEPAQY